MVFCLVGLLKKIGTLRDNVKVSKTKMDDFRSSSVFWKRPEQLKGASRRKVKVHKRTVNNFRSYSFFKRDRGSKGGQVRVCQRKIHDSRSCCVFRMEQNAHKRIYGTICERKL